MPNRFDPPRRWSLPFAVRESFAGNLMSGEDEGEDARWSAAQNIDQPTIEILCAVVSQFYRRSTSYTDWYDRDRLLWVTVAYPQDQPGAWGCEVFLSFTDDNTQEP